MDNMKNDELVKELKQIDKDFETTRKKYQKIMSSDNSIEKLVEINKEINKMVKESKLKTYDYSKAKKKRTKRGEQK